MTPELDTLIAEVIVIDKPVDASVPDDISKLPRLEDWAEWDGHLTGNVYNHPRIADGEWVTTSRIVWINRDIGLAQTRNTLYALVGKKS